MKSHEKTQRSVQGCPANLRCAQVNNGINYHINWLLLPDFWLPIQPLGFRSGNLLCKLQIWEPPIWPYEIPLVILIGFIGIPEILAYGLTPGPKLASIIHYNKQTNIFFEHCSNIFFLKLLVFINIFTLRSLEKKILSWFGTIPTPTLESFVVWCSWVGYECMYRNPSNQKTIETCHLDQESHTHNLMSPWQKKSDLYAFGQITIVPKPSNTWITFLGTNISILQTLLKMIFLFQRWDILVS